MDNPNQIHVFRIRRKLWRSFEHKWLKFKQWLVQFLNFNESVWQFSTVRAKVGSGNSWVAPTIFFLLFLAFLAFHGAGELLVFSQRARSDVTELQLQFASGVQNLNSEPSLAKQNFVRAQDIVLRNKIRLSNLGLPAKTILKFSGRGRAVDAALSAAEDMSRAGASFSEAINAYTAKSPQEYLPSWEDGINYISSAVDKFSTVDARYVPQSHREQFLALTDLAQNLRQELVVLSETTALLRKISEENLRLVIMLQNPSEIRATGGFWGTVGEVSIEEGRLEQTKVTSVYEYDGKVTPEEGPPFPLLAVNDRWYLRDANWFFDFKSSGELGQKMFESEAGYTPDAFLALSPEIFESILQETGPLEVQGETLTSENFLEIIQLKTSVESAINTGRPSKEFLGQILPGILSRYNSLPTLTKLQLLTEAYQRRDLQVYSTRNDIGNWAKVLFDQSAQTQSRDSLALVSSNLGGTKTDRSLLMEAVLNTQIDQEGMVTNTVTLNVENPLPQKPSFTNTNFLRIYVPRGSRLVSAKGFSKEPYLAKNTRTTTLHPAAALWESKISQDLSSGTYTGEEGDYSFFGNWLVLQGGEKAVVQVSYVVPFRIASIDSYTMLVRRQAGTKPYTFSQTVGFQNRTVLAREGFSSNKQTLTENFTSEVSKDLYLGLVLKQNQ